MDLNNYRIIVVDDNEDMRDLIAEFLESTGATVIKAENAESCLEKLKKSSFDAMVSDIQMPGMNGIELCKMVKEDYPEMRVLMVSGSSGREYMDIAHLLGVDVLSKPIKSSVFLDKIRGLFFPGLNYNGNKPDFL